MTVGRMLTLTGCVVLISTGSFAQAMSDADYCHQLSTLYRMFRPRRPSRGCAMTNATRQLLGRHFRLEEIVNGRRIPLPPRGVVFGTSAFKHLNRRGRARCWPAPWPALRPTKMSTVFNHRSLQLVPSLPALWLRRHDPDPAGIRDRRCARHRERHVAAAASPSGGEGLIGGRRRDVGSATPTGRQQGEEPRCIEVPAVALERCA